MIKIDYERLYRLVYLRSSAVGMGPVGLTGGVPYWADCALRGLFWAEGFVVNRAFIGSSRRRIDRSGRSCPSSGKDV